MYIPQKRQPGSAFALTYSFFLRSCKLMDAFLISPLPPLCQKRYPQQGAFPQPELPGVLGTSHPSDTLSSPINFPVLPVI
jgi:hypothetical protein